MLSSTFTDLEQHRKRAIDAISKLGYLPRVMEHSAAQAERDVIDTSLAMVRDAAAYVGVIGQKYGQTPYDPVRNPERRSITELEFDEAMRLKRPIVLFIMGDEHPLRKPDVEVDPDKRKKLDAFRERAKLMRGDGEVQRVYELFQSLDEFSTQAAVAIGNLVRYLERLEQGKAPEKPPERTDVDREPERTLSNIPINVPRHFLGRDDDLAAIHRALNSGDGRAAITALHGLRGVGKTTLAAAYAGRHRENYRATWWIRAETEPTLRADLVGLGVQMGWVAGDAAEEPAVAETLRRLSGDGERILLIYDNATNPNDIYRFLPRGAGPHIIITSNAPNWSRIAAPVEIEVWPMDIGADFLIARTGRKPERDAAMALSEALGGLPLAHDQAAAYCERIGISLIEYLRRFENTPAVLLDDTQDISREYGLTVSKTFALAISEAAKRHPAAEPLIVYAALLAPEPIPLFLFSEGREEFAEPFASAIAGDGLDEAVAALRTFALVDREEIPDERDPEIKTDCIRLHRLVRQVAAGQPGPDARMDIRRELIEAMALVYPADVHRDPATWPRARRLDALAIPLVADSEDLLEESEISAATLLDRLGAYRAGALAAYSEAHRLFDCARAIYEVTLGPDHPHTARSLNNLGYLSQAQGDLASARPHYERALAIHEKIFGPDHPDTATSLSNLGALLRAQGDLAGARPHYERALAICKRALGPDHPDTAVILNNLGGLLQEQGDPAGAWPHYERALAICEKALGPDHPNTAASLNNLGHLLHAQGDFAGARPHYERALAIYEKTLGPDHPDTAFSLNNLGALLRAQGDLAGARPYYERALAIRERALGPDHPDTAVSLNNLGYLLWAQGDSASAPPHYERALAIFEKVLGIAHPSTKGVAGNTALLLEALNRADEAKALRDKYGISDQDEA